MTLQFNWKIAVRVASRRQLVVGLYDETNCFLITYDTTIYSMLSQNFHIRFTYFGNIDWKKLNLHLNLVLAMID